MAQGEAEALLVKQDSNKVAGGEDVVEGQALGFGSTDVSAQPTTMFFLRQRKILVNLIIMTYIWSASSFAYYMVAF